MCAEFEAMLQIVRASLCGVREYLVGLANLFEFLFGAWRLILVRMPFLGQLVIGLLNLVLAGRRRVAASGQAEHSVVVDHASLLLDHWRHSSIRIRNKEIKQRLYIAINK